ncbi:ABC transporter substrate-binding protein, partial [Streptomyces parvulus]|nr:ABC transporter substrate-binding protein [Streptomyces parvulus]
MNVTHPRPRTTRTAALAAALPPCCSRAPACSSKAESGGGGDAADGVKAGPGVSEKHIKLGALTDLTGP